MGEEIQQKEKENSENQKKYLLLKSTAQEFTAKNAQYEKQLNSYNQQIEQLLQKRSLNEADQKNVINVIEQSKIRLNDLSNLKQKLLAELEKVNQDLDILRVNIQQISSLKKKIHDQTIENNMQIEAVKRLQQSKDSLEQDFQKLQSVNVLSSNLENSADKNAESQIRSTSQAPLEASSGVPEKLTKIKIGDIRNMKQEKE